MTRNHTTQSRWRQAPALVISLVALFAALSGAALALPGTETVNSGDIKNEAVKSVDLKDGKAVASADVVDQTITGQDVQDESLQSVDVQDGTLLSSDVADQALTGNDVAGDTLQANDLAPNSVGSSELQNGSVGASEVGDGIVVRAATTNVNGGTAENGAYNFGTATANCAAGEELIGGNAYWVNDAAGDELTIAEVVPNHNGESVTVRGGNDSGDDATLVAYVECL